MKNVGIEYNGPPNQLRQGYGTPICIVLLSLIDKVIQKIGFSFKKPKLEENKGNSKDDRLDIEDEIPDLINNEINYDDDINADKKKPNKDNKKKGGEQQDDGTGIMFSGTTQEDWQRELEKVSLKLKIEYGKINAMEVQNGENIFNKLNREKKNLIHLFQNLEQFWKIYQVKLIKVWKKLLKKKKC